MAEIGQQLQDLKLANSQLVAALVDKRERRGRSPYRHNGRRNTKSPHRSPYRSPHRSPYRYDRSYRFLHASPYRSYSPCQQRSRSNSRSRYSHRSPKRVSFDIAHCYVCGSTEHKAKDCPDNNINRKGSNQEN